MVDPTSLPYFPWRSARRSAGSGLYSLAAGRECVWSRGNCAIHGLEVRNGSGVPRVVRAMPRAAGLARLPLEGGSGSVGNFRNATDTVHPLELYWSLNLGRHSIFLANSRRPVCEWRLCAIHPSIHRSLRDNTHIKQTTTTTRNRYTMTLLGAGFQMGTSSSATASSAAVPLSMDVSLGTIGIMHLRVCEQSNKQTNKRNNQYKGTNE